MIDTKMELEWFLMGIAITGGRDKFIERQEQFDETVGEIENTEDTLNLRL